MKDAWNSNVQRRKRRRGITSTKHYPFEVALLVRNMTVSNI
jgi:hypothetical protein